MDRDEIYRLLEKCIHEDRGDYGRNRYLQNRLKRRREVLESDKKYLKKLLKKELDVARSNKKTKVSKKVISVPENELAKCQNCNSILNLDEKTVRYKKNWYHPKCFTEVTQKNKDIKPKIKNSVPKKVIPKRPDSVQIAIVASIFVIMVSSVYFLLGFLSMIAMGLGGVMLVYHLFNSHTKLFAKNKPGKKGPSAMVVFLLGTPFIIGG